MNTLNELAALLDSQHLLLNGKAPKKAAKCDGGRDSLFAQFGPCRCTDCEPTKKTS